jgi:ribonuclease R
VGEEFSGTISGVAPFGVFVTLDSLYVDGLVHVSELGTEYFQFNESMHELRGEHSGIRYRLTDRIHVQLARVDIEARRMDFRLVKSPGAKAEQADEADAGRKGARPAKHLKGPKAKTPAVKQAIEARKQGQQDAAFKKGAASKNQARRSAAKKKRGRH